MRTGSKRTGRKTFHHQNQIILESNIIIPMKIFRFIYLIALTAFFITPVVAQNENADAVYKKLVKEYT